jgi:hypothetical protein
MVRYVNQKSKEKAIEYGIFLSKFRGYNLGGSGQGYKVKQDHKRYRKDQTKHNEVGIMSLLDKYRVRLKQLESGFKELYDGEREVIQDVIKAMEKDN